MQLSSFAMYPAEARVYVERVVRKEVAIWSVKLKCYVNRRTT